MDKTRRIKQKKSRRHSFIWQALDRFTAFIYSLFIFGKVGEKISEDRTYSKRSFLAQSFSHRNKVRIKIASLGISGALNKNAIVRLLRAIGSALAYLKLNVYGTFFTIYGLTAALAYYIMMLIKGESLLASSNLDLIITSAAISLCSVPLLFSSQTATAAMLKSKLMRRVVLDFFDIPEEKLQGSSVYGGKQYVLVAVVSAIGLGAVAYFLNPWYIPVMLLCMIALYLIFANPEVGVILTITSVPFLQFAGVTRAGLTVIILVTSVSYICKLIQRRRSMDIGPEVIMSVLFCAFIFASSIFTGGGAEVTADALSYVVIILGGFFLTYNLINSQKAIRICVKTLTAVLIICSLIGIWDGFYNGIAHRISDPTIEHITGISHVDVMAMLDGGEAFGVLAVMVFPLLFAYASKKKSVKGAALMIITGVITLVAAWMCTRYEIVVCLLIEAIIFWILYSHTSLTVMIIAALPISIAALLYPYAIAYWDWPDLSMILAEYMPASLHSTAINDQAASIVLDMIFNGNLVGIGAGSHAVEVILPAYSSILSPADVSSASVWLQILCWSGIFGLVAFVAFVVFIAKRSFRCFTASYQKNHQSVGLALFCGIMAALLLGMVTNVWINEGMMFIFWVNAGLLMSHIRASDGERAKRESSLYHTEDRTDTEVIFYK